MRRYYVVLPGTAGSGPYVVAEVVREPGDDERSREQSLAADLAGPNASIFTAEELTTTRPGRSALARWRAGNDNSFNLETLSLAWDLDPGRSIMPAHEPRDRHELLQRIAERTSEVRNRSIAARRENERSRSALRGEIGELQENLLKCSASLAELDEVRGKPIPRRKERRLRSVS